MERSCTGIAAREAGWGNGDADGVGERHGAGRRARDWRGDHAELRRRAELLGRGCGRWASAAWEIAAAWCAWCWMGGLVHVVIISGCSRPRAGHKHTPWMRKEAYWGLLFPIRWYSSCRFLPHTFTVPSCYDLGIGSYRVRSLMLRARPTEPYALWGCQF